MGLTFEELIDKFDAKILRVIEENGRYATDGQNESISDSDPDLDF